MFDYYELEAGSDILNEVLDSLDRYEIEDFLGQSMEEYLAEVETFRITAGMFPKKQDKQHEVIKFRANDLDEVSQFFRMLKLLVYSLDSEDLITTEEFGDTYSVIVRFNDHKYYTINLCKYKGYSISLVVTTCSELVEELAIA